MSPYKLLLLLLLPPSVAVFGQNVILKGKIIDKATHKPLEAATVFISSEQDSTLVDYTISDRNGTFSITTRKITQPVTVTTSFIGYQDRATRLPSLEKSLDLGAIAVEEGANILSEVTVRSEAPPVRVKKDTLEFNAASFNVRDDANVEALLKKLPGVEITPDGKIKVNGKEVNNILVNGKPFFGKDGKIATQNLPAEIIDKVQITDTKTKEEELSGDAASSDQKTINLTISEDKNKGLFGKAMAGAGTNGRYETSGMFNYFKDKRKVSVLVSSNNINTSGFSMDEVFDSMGGGRNVYSSSDGSFNIDGVQFGGGKGITRSSMAGLNYQDEFGKKNTAGGSYFYTSSENENHSVSRMENLQNNTVETSESNSNSAANAHNVNMEIEVKPDSLTTINIRPNFKRANSHYNGKGDQFTTDDAGTLLNDKAWLNDNTTHNDENNNSIYAYRGFKKKGRSVYGYSEIENKNEDARNLNISTTNFYAKDSIVARDQKQLNQNTKDRFMGSLNYTEPIQGDSLTVSIGFKWEHGQETFNRKTFANNGGQYTDLLDEQTNYMRSGTTRFNPFTRVSFKKKKYNLGARLGTEIVSYRNYANYLSEETNINRDYLFPTAGLYGSYRPNKSASLYTHYNFEATLPTANQLLPVENLADPLNVITGNPLLKPTYRHSIYLGYNDYDYATKSGFNLWSGGGYYQNQIVAYTLYDASAGRRTTFANTDNAYNGWMGFNWNKSIKKEAHKYGFSLEMNTNFGLEKGITNNGGYQARSLSLSPQLQLSYDYGELLNVAPSYNVTYNQTRYDNYSIDYFSSVVHNVKIQTTSHYPKNVVWGNDFSYTYNAGLADGFKKDFYLWNMSLGYNFMKEAFLAKVKVYDLLNQNLNNTRSISPTAITDEQNTVLKRYLMLSLTYKIEKFGGKPKSRWEE